MAKANLWLLDTPYDFSTYSAKGITSRSAKTKYGVMSWDELHNLWEPLNDASDSKNCVMYLWTSSPVLHHHMRLMDEWGFDYKGQVIWGKVTKDESRIRIGTGYTFRNACESIIYGTRRGCEQPTRYSKSEPNLFLAPLGKHSEKPIKFHESLNRLYGNDITKVECFARKRLEFPNWHFYGNELTGNDICVDLHDFINQ